MSWQTFALCRTWFCTNHGLWIWVILEIYESGEGGYIMLPSTILREIPWILKSLGVSLFLRITEQLRGSMNVCYNIVCFFSSCVNSTSMFWNELSYSSLSLCLSLSLSVTCTFKWVWLLVSIQMVFGLLEFQRFELF
jgi:hypothetical protein